jgi:hypothetical protein
MAGKGKSTIETSNPFVDDSYSQQNADVRIGQYVQISVSDTGCGMPREVQEKRSTRSSRPRSPGHGAGPQPGLLNLALNAQDAMDAGGSLSISTANALLGNREHNLHPDVRDGAYVVIAVTDNGKGMPKALLARAFEPFFTTKEVSKGNGLGLSLVYGFAKQSNGHVSTTWHCGPDPFAGAGYKGEGNSRSGAARNCPERRRDRADRRARSFPPFLCRHEPADAGLSGHPGGGRQGSDAEAANREAHRSVVHGYRDAGRRQPLGTRGAGAEDEARTAGSADLRLCASGQLHDGSMILSKPYRKAELARRLREALSTPLPH